MALAQELEDDRVELAMVYAAGRIGVPSLNAKQKQAVRAFLDGRHLSQLVQVPNTASAHILRQTVSLLQRQSRQMRQAFRDSVSKTSDRE